MARIRNLPHFQFQLLKNELSLCLTRRRCQHASEENVTRNGKSWLSCRQQPNHQASYRRGLVLSCAANQSVRALEARWSFYLHFPIVIGVRSDNGHSPLSRPVTQHVFKDGHNLPANLRIARILNLDPDSHVFRIVQKGKTQPLPCCRTDHRKQARYAASTGSVLILRC